MAFRRLGRGVRNSEKPGPSPEKLALIREVTGVRTYYEIVRGLSSDPDILRAANQAEMAEFEPAEMRLANPDSVPIGELSICAIKYELAARQVAIRGHQLEMAKLHGELRDRGC